MDSKHVSQFETPSLLHERNVQRLKRCLYTLTIIDEQVFDPIDVESRADLVLIAEEVASYAIAIASNAREFAWQELDANAPEGADN